MAKARKKWQRCWEEVLYCSKRCRSDYGRRSAVIRAKRSSQLRQAGRLRRLP
ncbi:MAG: DUF2256 domain-containing protein [Pseudomonadota bacterium]